MKNYYLLSLICLFFIGCSKTSHLQQPVADLTNIKQSCQAYINSSNKNLIPGQKQQKLFTDFKSKHFDPWQRTKPAFDAEYVFWGLKVYGKKKIFGANKLPINSTWMQKMADNSQIESYPSQSLKAITVVNTSMRVLPTNQPVFYDFAKAGEGFPFDYMQNTAILADTPLYVSHFSKDGKWALAESRFAFGWIDVRHLAWCDEQFCSQFCSFPLAAVLSENLPIKDNVHNFLVMGKIGMVCPKQGDSLLIALRDENGQAVMGCTAQLLPGQAQIMPVACTSQNMAKLIDQLLGQQYGWGGLYGLRDCSATILDLFVPFGVYLPRNSSQQAKVGPKIDLTNLNPEQKKQIILQQGQPFTTLVYKPGHIMLYLGPLPGSESEPAILHTAWGLKTMQGEQEGRKILGQTVITSLQPGAEIKQVVSSFINSVKSINFPCEQ